MAIKKDEVEGFGLPEDKAPAPKQEVNNDVTSAILALAKSIEKSNSKNSNADLADKLASVLNSQNNVGYKTGFVKQEQIDPEDYIDGGYAFYCHQGGYVITSDKRQGREVETPFGNPIFFDFQHSSVKGSGKDVRIEPLAQYVSYSKKEVKWLKESSFYGWKIFDDFSRPQTESAMEAVKLAQYYGRMKDMSTGEIMKTCKHYGLPISKDVDSMKLAVAQHYSRQEIEKEKEANKIRAINAIKEQDLVPK